jgi:hypothetical protein
VSLLPVACCLLPVACCLLPVAFSEGASPQRTCDDTVIEHLEGGSVEGLFIATWGYEWARARGLGTPFDLSS